MTYESVAAVLAFTVPPSAAYAYYMVKQLQVQNLRQHWDSRIEKFRVELDLLREGCEVLELRADSQRDNIDTLLREQAAHQSSINKLAEREFHS